MKWARLNGSQISNEVVYNENVSLIFTDETSDVIYCSLCIVESSVNLHLIRKCTCQAFAEIVCQAAGNGLHLCDFEERCFVNLKKRFNNFVGKDI